MYILYKTLLDVITYCCLCYNHCYHFMNYNNTTPSPPPLHFLGYYRKLLYSILILFQCAALYHFYCQGLLGKHWNKIHFIHFI